MKQVMQLNVYMRSPEQAKEAAAALKLQEGCLEAHYQGYCVSAHFEIPDNFPPDAVPDGCRLVPADVVDYIKGRYAWQQ